MSLLVGIVFYQLGNYQLSIRDRFSLCFLSSALYPFGNVLLCPHNFRRFMVILDSIARFCDERAQARIFTFLALIDPNPVLRRAPGRAV